MAEATPTTDATPAEPAAPENGQTAEPSKDDTGTKSDAGKTFDESYVRALRKEAADNRKAREAAEARAQELEDRDKSEAEKLASRAAESERRAAEAEARLLRLEVAAERGFQASAVPLLGGVTRDEIEASADALAAFAKDNTKPASGFDGGARKTPDETKPPEQAHNDWLMQALGRRP